MGLIKRGSKAFGVDIAEAPSEEDEAAQRREANIKLAWDWLRQRLDLDIEHYFKTGSTSKLEQHCVAPALDRIVTQLEAMRSRGLVWRQPERQVRTQRELEVLEMELDAQGKLPTMFIIQEAFTDRSVLEQVDASGIVAASNEAHGVRRVLQATVICPGATDYRLRDVRQVTLGE